MKKSNEILQYERNNVAGGYNRVSSEEQAREGYSIEAQADSIKAYALAKSYVLADIYSDKGISGKDIDGRQELKRLIEDVKAGKINNVIVYKLDRLTRSLADLLYLVDLFNQYDCSFTSITENIDTKTASGRMFLQIIGIFAEFERNNLIERVTMGLEKKAREGYRLNSNNVSYGYSMKKGEKIQTIIEEEAEIVREIFELYVNKHKSFTWIAKHLNMRGIKTKKGNTNWNGGTIQNIITNPTYIGMIRYSVKDKNRYFEAEGHHTSIISEDLYEKAQTKHIKMKKITHTKRPKEDNYYTGILYCDKCGGKLKGHITYKQRKDGLISKTTSYVCTNTIIRICEARHYISHNKIDQAFQEYIDNIAEFDVISELTIKENENVQNNEKIKADCNARFNRLLAKEKEIISLYTDDRISFDEYAKMVKQVQDDLSKIKKELSNLQTDTDENSSIRKEDVIKSIKKNWEYLSDVERLEFLHTFVKKIIVSIYTHGNDKLTKVSILDIEFEGALKQEKPDEHILTKSINYTID